MIVYGASGHAQVIVDILLLNGHTISLIADDRPPAPTLLGIPVHKTPPHFPAGAKAVIAIGSNRIRQQLVRRHPTLDYAMVVHPRATVSPFASVGAGSVVMAHAAVNPGAAVGDHCILNTGCIIEHECVLGDFVHISPNAALAGQVRVEEGAHVGIGASVIQGVTIGKWATVGAGAVVIRDVPSFATVVGNPARVIRVEEC